MKIRSVINSVVLGAGICIFAIGMALAQGAPAPSGTPSPGASSPGMSGREACRAEVNKDLRGPERREAMKKCMAEKREARRPEREARRAKTRDDSKLCRDELKDQRFTEAERRTAMRDCMVKKDPARAKAAACTSEAEGKKLERRTKEFRDFMRQCNKAP